jgi:y4mF family transcriptional regulator
VALVRTPTEVGALVRTGRKARGWSQQQAADAAGVSRRFVNMVEDGHRNAEMWRVLALLDAVGVTLDATTQEPAAGPLGDGGTAVAPAPIADAPDPDALSLDEHLRRFRGGTQL